MYRGLSDLEKVSLNMYVQQSAGPCKQTLKIQVPLGSTRPPKYIYKEYTILGLNVLEKYFQGYKNLKIFYKSL